MTDDIKEMELEKLNESVEVLVESLSTQITQLQSWVKCRHIKTTKEDRDELVQIEERISKLETTVSAMDATIRKEEESLVFIERMTECVQKHNKKISYIMEHIPPQLPNIPANFRVASNALANIMNHKQQSHSSTHSLLHSQQAISPPNQHNNPPRRGKRKAETMDDNPRATKRRRMNDNHPRNIPQIEIVGKDEFDSVPKYVRGRLTQNRLNDSINEYNKHLLAKYRIIHMNPSKLNKHQFDLYEKYMKEDTKETKQSYWLSHDNFRDSKNFTFDQTGKAIFAVMRHLKRIKMISGKKPKYVVL
eukprot:194917_1